MAKRTVEVPRLRFAVRNELRNEIYNWTALPSRSLLGPGKTLPFQSRLGLAAARDARWCASLTAATSAPASREA